MIILKKDLPDTYTNESGFKLYCMLKEHLEMDKIVKVSFKDVTTSTSFLNSSFGEIIENYGIEKLKCLVKPINVSNGQSSILKEYLSSISKSVLVA